MTTRRTMIERVLYLLGAGWALPRAALARVPATTATPTLPIPSIDDDGTEIVDHIEAVLEPWVDAIEAEGSDPCFHPCPRCTPWEERWAAMVEFSAVMEPTGSRAPALLDIVFNEGETGANVLAVVAYRRLGCEIAKPCLELLENGEASPALRWLAAVSLGLSGPAVSIDAPGPLLAQLTIERDPEVRSAILWALGQIAPRGVFIEDEEALV